MRRPVQPNLASSSASLQPASASAVARALQNPMGTLAPEAGSVAGPPKPCRESLFNQRLAALACDERQFANRTGSYRLEEFLSHGDRDPFACFFRIDANDPVFQVRPSDPNGVAAA